MLVRCLRTFLDLETGEMRNVGERFEVTAERLSAINSTRYGQLVEVVEEKPSEAVSEPQKAIPAKPTTRRRGRAKKTAQTEE